MRVRYALWLIVAAGVLYMGLWFERRMAHESAPVARGAAYAQPKGCVACHGDPNNPALDKNDSDCSDSNTMPRHPDYEIACTDVLAYFEAVRLSRNQNDYAAFNPDNPLLAGEQLARQYHCFNCHGQLGQGGFKNSAALKGYVPGYFGDDFRALTRNADPDSVREWIMHGMDAELLEPPLTGRIAAFFFDRQAVRMPSYKSLQADEIDSLVDYVIALNRFGPMTAEGVRSYGELSRSSEVHETHAAEFTEDGQLVRPDDWREWIFVGMPVTPNALNAGKAVLPEAQAVYIDPRSWNHWKETGRFRDGTMFAVELTVFGTEGADELGASLHTIGRGYFQDDFSGLMFSVKDSMRFPDEPGNWAYFSSTLGLGESEYPETMNALPTAACNGCHAVNGAEDWVFSQYYPVLKAARPE